jgi:uncharacterized DUF497 family protein
VPNTVELPDLPRFVKPHFDSAACRWYVVGMGFECDEGKSRNNLLQRGFDFSVAYCFDFETALTVIDDRHDYGELRYRSVGTANNKLFSVVWTPRNGKLRIISVRRANKKERKLYAIHKQS